MGGVDFLFIFIEKMHLHLKLETYIFNETDNHFAIMELIILRYKKCNM
jgi:hypothetical protein